jgi:hypothetical protein
MEDRGDGRRHPQPAGQGHDRQAKGRRRRVVQRMGDTSPDAHRQEQATASPPGEEQRDPLEDTDLDPGYEAEDAADDQCGGIP